MRSYSKKEAKAFRPSQILPAWQETQRSHFQLKQTVHQQTIDLSNDPIDFLEKVLGYKLYGYQKEFADLFENNQFTAARWCRQSGKTQTISALLLRYAVKNANSAIGIVGPSWRQTKRIITRIAAHARRLPPGIVLKSQKTQIDFANGSSIEAFPNNPETIRGPTLHVVYADEFNFVANDQELYDAILYTKAHRRKFDCSAPPWHTTASFSKFSATKTSPLQNLTSHRATTDQRH
jgi:hypothetical protein